MEANQAQEEAIRTVEGQLIVVACPGSGKTTTLVRRIHHMVEDCGIQPEHILMITFTAAAAKEMRTRYQKQYGKDEVTFCTIHSLCLAILRKFAGITNDDILSDARAFFYDRLRKEKSINDKESFIKLLLTDISVVKNNSLTLAEYQPQCCSDQQLFESLFRNYEEYKEQEGLIDFDDMLIRAYQLLEQDGNCLAWIRDRYRYIQVDEYQDTNFLQRDLVYLIAGKDGNLAVVGDDDQSIYGFRGARPEVMLKFQDYYPRARMIRMSTNYRSCSGIIALADRLIRQNTARFPKQFLSFHKEEGNITRIRKQNRMAELYAVVTKVRDLIRSGEDPNQIAILYRTNRQAEAPAAILTDARIPFVTTEKIQSLYKHWMFGDLQAFYRLANDRDWTRRDLARVLNHPQRFLQDPGYLHAGLSRSKMMAVAYRTGGEAWKRDKAVEQVDAFFRLIRMLKGKEPEEFLKILSLLGPYRNYLEENAKYMQADVTEFLDIWNRYQEDAKKWKTWKDWGAYIVRYNHTMEEAQKNREGVTLSTMHCSKGLEWKQVFLIDCVDGICPYEKAESDAAKEEERRLFYVAMTRAKENLYLCTYEEKGRDKVKPSPFL